MDARNETTSPGTSHSNFKRTPARRRARRACIACHERKVRCDVLQRQPCTNCEEDRCKWWYVRNRSRALTTHASVIRSHANRRASVAALELPSPAATASNFDSCIQYDHLTPYVRQRAQENLMPKPSTLGVNDQQVFESSVLDINRDWLSRSSATIMPDPGNFEGFSEPLYYDFDALTDGNALLGLERVFNPLPSFSGDALTSHPMAHQSPSVSMSGIESVQSPAPDCIDFSGSFIGHQAIVKHSERAQELEFLRSQGCFLFPSAQLFLELMIAYFTYVHPSLPIINEGDFWGLWANDTFRLGSFSALVLQSMAFAATSFTSPSTLQQYGFSSAKKARLTFHRRAKLLFDMDIESDAVSISQSALLLTYYTSNENRFLLNSQWLARAIRFAKLARADRFDEAGLEEQKKKQTLKRLWWGCKIRDRVMSLGLRRPLQIRKLWPHSQDESRFLSEEDFTDELGMSRVHDEQTQRIIFRIIHLSSKLTEALTPALLLLYSAERPRDRARSTLEDFPQALMEVRRQFEHLRRWQEAALQAFPSPIGLDEEHPTVSIFANLMFIYYNGAVLALGHHAMLLWESKLPSLVERPPFVPPTPEIVAAVSDTTDRVRELVQLRCAQHLPISVSAFLTLPLLLHALSVKATASETDAALARRQLSIYTRCMKLQQNLYDGADFVHELIENVQRYSDEQNPSMPSIPTSIPSVPGDAYSRTRANASGQVSGSATPNHAGRVARQSPAWQELLVRRPRLYLRLVLHLDVALCEGVLPTEYDFPEELRRISRSV